MKEENYRKEKGNYPDNLSVTIVSFPKKKHMQILSLILPLFNSISNGILHGPAVIPKWHPLYGKKYYSWGTYKRQLKLYDGATITVIVHRFYLPEKKKTYSLLPFFISPYQRHINTVIQDCILSYVFENKSFESLSRHPSPKPRTVRRWVNNFIILIDYKLRNFELFLSTRLSLYRTADSPLHSIYKKVEYLFDNAKYIIDNSVSYQAYGELSYIYQAIAVQTAKL